MPGPRLCRCQVLQHLVHRRAGGAGHQTQLFLGHGDRFAAELLGQHRQPAQHPRRGGHVSAVRGRTVRDRPPKGWTARQSVTLDDPTVRAKAGDWMSPRHLRSAPGAGTTRAPGRGTPERGGTDPLRHPSALASRCVRFSGSATQEAGILSSPRTKARFKLVLITGAEACRTRPQRRHPRRPRHRPGGSMAACGPRRHRHGALVWSPSSPSRNFGWVGSGFGCMRSP